MIRMTKPQVKGYVNDVKNRVTGLLVTRP